MLFVSHEAQVPLRLADEVLELSQPPRRLLGLRSQESLSRRGRRLLFMPSSAGRPFQYRRILPWLPQRSGRFVVVQPPVRGSLHHLSCRSGQALRHKLRLVSQVFDAFQEDSSAPFIELEVSELPPQAREAHQLEFNLWALSSACREVLDLQAPLIDQLRLLPQDAEESLWCELRVVP